MLTRRPAAEADIPFLMRLRQDTMNAHLAAAGASVDEANHQARLMYRFDCAEVLLNNGQAIGLLKVVREAAEWHVVQIQLAASSQGRGLGRDMLDQVIAEARLANVPIALSVLKANPAKHLYERLGFEVVGEGDYEYQMRLLPAPHHR